ncbi:hypothetical protein HNQ60_004523 [Povalibacter uvarum]|uniref:Apea-like HEPN domain-containing protein n=1 Tax=Povalibacter uvarum TaxID=732238 RepID=A0A841HUH2_9GAMM|nr:hypothetical protein [Povalibacter uvarum]MBB6095632.1 hypothetical protein [Povalibacter uvarum]
MEISTAALDAMGFKDGLEVEATFHSVNVYSLSGITCSQPTTLESAIGKTAQHSDYQLAVGLSVNEACKRLIGDTLVEDELKWMEERACCGPYLLVAIKVNPAKRIGRVKEEIASISTYGMFSMEKAAIAAIESDVLPRAVTSVTQLISAAGYVCAARHVAREVFGLDPALRPVHDIRFSLSGTGSSSRLVSDAIIRSAVAEAPGLAHKLDPKVARFLRLAEDEVDLLRRFLFFFLAVEVETHRAFAAIDHASLIPDLLDPSLPHNAIIRGFLREQPERLKNLKDRFTWCAMFAWPAMTDVDVQDFARLKSVRDKLSHGEITAPPPEAVISVEALARRLQHYRIPPESMRRMVSPDE